MRTEMWNSIAIVVLVIALAAGGPWLVRELRTLPGRQALVARAEQRIVTLEVGGMTCEGCASTIQGTLAGVSGVAAVNVRLGQDRAYVVCDRAVADSSLAGAVHRAGPGFVARVVQK